MRVLMMLLLSLSNTASRRVAALRISSLPIRRNKRILSTPYSITQRASSVTLLTKERVKAVMEGPMTTFASTSSNISTLTKTSIRRMKLSDLQMELSFRGMDTKGARDVLVKRLLDVLDEDEVESLPTLDPSKTYVLRVRGHTTPNSGGGGVGMVLYEPEDERNDAKLLWKGRLYVAGDRTVFEAEYTAVVLGMDYAYQVLGVRKLVLQSDNDVVVRQMDGEYKVNKESLQTLLRSFEHRKQQFPDDTLLVTRIAPSNNDLAGGLARKALATRKSLNIQEEWNVLDPLIELERVPVEGGRWKEPDEPSKSAVIDPSKVYLLRFDGGARGNPGVAGAGMVLYDDQGQEIWCGWKYHGDRSTNNVAEYLGLLCGLKCAQSLGIRRLIAEGDSQLIVRQLNGEYRCKEEKLRFFYSASLDVIKDLEYFEIRHIPRAENDRADWLANQAMDHKESHGFLSMEPDKEYFIDGDGPR